MPIPIQSFREPRLNRVGRLVAEQTFGLGYIRFGMADIAGSEIQISRTTLLQMRIIWQELVPQ